MSCGIAKNFGTVNGKRKHRPYTDRDGINFMIIEITEYKNIFFIIPIKELITRGYRTADQHGKLVVQIGFPSNNKHWTREYIDRFDLLEK